MPIERLLREAQAAYGKLGLLIEDAPDAALRVARELYGADGLPAWWLHFDNLEEGTQALKAALQTVVRGPSWARRLPLLVVLDRYLKESPASARTVAWDEGKHDQMVGIVQELEFAKEKGFPVHLEPVTSYPGPSHKLSEAVVKWRPRNYEPLYQLRRRLHEGIRDDPSALRPLLFFGPAERAPLIELRSLKGIFPQDRDRRVASCRARYWQKAINSLVEALSSADRGVACVLLTGAGASLACDPLAPGIPDTWYLLEQACWEVAGRPQGRRPKWPPDSCAREAVPPRQEVSTLAELRWHYEKGSSVRDLDWSLEKLFNRTLQDHGQLEELAAAFRHALQLWDHDFPYHSWLFSKLPWTLILTTNFDGFHERAAANAASLSSRAEVDRVRRLGDVLSLSGFHGDPAKPAGQPGNTKRRSNAFKKLLHGPGLLKPFGSLMTVGALALTHEDFWNRLKTVGQGALTPIASKSRECWIVVVGHRLASHSFHHSLMDLFQNHGPKIRLIWVEPSPYANQLENFASFIRLKEILDDGVDGLLDPFRDKPSACPLPARALDFAFDLWQEWERKHSRP